jgi:uncharacterized membrane protein YsdA (DUF1294 family)
LRHKGRVTTARRSGPRPRSRRIKSRPGSSSATSAFVAALGIFGLIGAAVFAGKLPLGVLVFYFAMSAFTFVVYLIDKAAAQSNRWRTEERVLHLCALIGGWPGAWVAQQLLRHKSIKIEFRRVFWATVVLNCAALTLLLTPQGQALLGRK